MANDHHSISPLARRAAQRRRAYPVRIMIGLVASLLLILFVVHLPIYENPKRVGWLAKGDVAEPIMLKDLRMEESEEKEEDPTEGAPITIFDATEKDTDEGEETAGQEEDPSQQEEEVDEDEPVPVQRLLGRTASLEARNRIPRVEGGMGNFYLRINYPEEARREGIQGRLVLEFIVERDGRTNHIQVADSLHPSLDSAAVAALEDTHFVPGRQNGEEVRVRMRLPVRFKLVGFPSEQQTADAESNDVQQP